MFFVFLQRGMRYAGRTIRATVKTSPEGQATDFMVLVLRARVRHSLGVGVGNACGHGHGLGTAVQAKKARKRVTARSPVPDFLVQAAYEIQLAHARRHDVGHDVRLVHRLEHSGWRVAKAEHAVAAAVIDDCTLQRHDPRAGCGDRYIRHHGIGGIEIRQSILRRANLLGFVQCEEFRMGLLQTLELLESTVDGDGQIGVTREKFDNQLVIETDSLRSTARISHDIQVIEERRPSMLAHDMCHCRSH